MIRNHIFLLLCLVLLAPSCKQTATEPGGMVNDSLINAHLFSDPDSTFDGMEDIDSRDRENWQKPQMVISRLGDLSDKVVADIGAGTGYFTMRLARKAQRVIAIDIEQKFLDYIKRRLDKSSPRDHLQVETRLTQPDDPSLRESEADLVLLINTYSFISNRVDYFSKVQSGIRKGGRLVVVDFKKEPLPVGPPSEDKVRWQEVFMELDSAGFTDLQIDSTGLDYQYTVTAFK